MPKVLETVRKKICLDDAFVYTDASNNKMAFQLFIQMKTHARTHARESS